ncbi:transcription activator GLK1 isoform X2 [Lotus japonicus]|uniref:transcription activator GLK1 isoform X2 n=1 Tax=Lotus japonicus TaxID=34305 RepID=UPI002587B72E|nr:transcription activator GLK1 isoform X2 [Lotus japonicus]
MLTVSPLKSTMEIMENFSIGEGHHHVDFADLSDGNLLECIDFDDLFAGIDVLPDLEVNMEMLAEFSVSSGSDIELSVSGANSKSDCDRNDCLVTEKEKQDEEYKGASSDSSGSNSGSEEIVSKRDQSAEANPSPKEGDKGRKSSSSAQSKNPQGKRKVDWTPELHRRFVQAVEQLGVDKAVPSRILEIMGIDCLTRHNIASHLQKYRSHRKHLLARDAEAARWSQRRQVFGGGGGAGKRDINPWVAPTMGFPPNHMTPPPMHHFRPLHVWGHHMDHHSFMHMWPKHPPPPYAPPPPAWHQRAPNAPTPGTPCFPQPLTTTRFGAPTVPGIPPPPPPRAIGVLAGQTPPPPPLFDFHPSKESIDAALGDVLSKPWLPLPLGLKAPALDGVIGELQRQGVPRLPPSCA